MASIQVASGHAAPGPALTPSNPVLLAAAGSIVPAVSDLQVPAQDGGQPGAGVSGNDEPQSWVFLAAGAFLIGSVLQRRAQSMR
jgi:hypothetical protein